MTLGAIISLAGEQPQTRTAEYDLLVAEAAAQNASYIPDFAVAMFLNEEGQAALALMHSSKPDRGSAGI